MRLQRTRSSALPPHSPLIRYPLGEGRSGRAAAVTILSLAISVGVGAAQPQTPLPSHLEQGQDWYFAADHLTGAEYLRLGKDGTYETVGVEHTGVWQTDSGRWESGEDKLILWSDTHFLDVVAPPLRVYVFDRNDFAALPRLREAIARAISSAGKAPTLPQNAVKAITVTTNRKEGSQLTVDLDAETQVSGKPVPVQNLRSLELAIDQYLRAPNRNAFHYRVLGYRDLTFLLCLDPGGVAVMDSVESVRQEIDEQFGQAPSWIFAKITREEYEAGSISTYPFKFYPEMNRKPK